jgi:hypothetical protein
MEKKPKINPAAVDLLARVFNSHKKGLPEWMKNAREAYLRQNVEKAKRHVVINYKQVKNPSDCVLECIDFVEVSVIGWKKAEELATGEGGRKPRSATIVNR